MEELETITATYDTPEACFRMLRKLCGGRQVYSVYLCWDEGKGNYDLCIVVKTLEHQELPE